MRDAYEERQLKIEEGRRRLEKLRSKKQHAVQAGSRALPSPFATTARKPPPEFKGPEAGRKSSNARGEGGTEVVEAGPARPEEQNQPQPQQDAGGERTPQSERRPTLDTVDLKDPKSIDDQIQRLRELDRSFTPPLKVGKSLAQPQPAGIEPPQEPSPRSSKGAQTLQAEEAGPTQAAPAAPNVAELQEPSASHTRPAAPPTEHLNEQAPQSLAPSQLRQAPEAPPAIVTPTAPGHVIGAHERTGVPPGYISSTLTGAPRGAYFGTGELVTMSVRAVQLRGKRAGSLLTEHVMDAGRSAQLEAAAAFSAVPEPAERVDAPTQADAQPYVTDGVVFTS